MSMPIDKSEKLIVPPGMRRGLHGISAEFRYLGLTS
jgi:hypothetical protein